MTGTLTNPSSSTVTISQASVTGAAFSLSGLPLSLSAGQSQPFSVIFAPQIAGTTSGNTIPNEEQREPAISLLHKAKVLCLVSRALATAQKFETRVEISKHSHQSDDHGLHVH